MNESAANGHPFSLKPWLDTNVVPLLRPEPPLDLHSVLVDQAPGATRPHAVLVWTLSKTADGWAAAAQRLLESAGFCFDFTREPQLVVLAPGRTITIFGGDGMPFVGANGMAMVRLFRRVEDGVDLIIEVGHLFPDGKAAVAAVRAFFEQFGQDPAALLARYSPRFGSV